MKLFLRFDMTEMIAESRILLNANYIVSTWVYLDDLDTSKNVLYVRVLFSFKYGLFSCLWVQVDQPELGLPLSMYLDTESYAEYITAYKTFMFELAKVLVRELGTSVSDDQIHTQLEQAFDFERRLATVSSVKREERIEMFTDRS